MFRSLRLKTSEPAVDPDPWSRSRYTTSLRNLRRIQLCRSFRPEQEKEEEARRSRWKFDVISVRAVYLRHGKGGSPNGTVAKLEASLRGAWPKLRYVRPALPHGDPAVPAQVSVEFLGNLQLDVGSLVLGVSLGGLVAAKLQEDSRPDLHVICISSPTWADGVRLQKLVANRISIYSPADEVIANGTEAWPRFAHAIKLQQLTHDTDQHLSVLVELIDSYLRGEPILRLSSS